MEVWNGFIANFSPPSWRRSRSAVGFNAIGWVYRWSREVEWGSWWRIWAIHGHFKEAEPLISLQNANSPPRRWFSSTISDLNWDFQLSSGKKTPPIPALVCTSSNSAIYLSRQKRVCPDGSIVLLMLIHAFYSAVLATSIRYLIKPNEISRYCRL